MRKLVREFGSQEIYVDLSRVEAIDDLRRGNNFTIVNLRMFSGDNHTVLVPDNDIEALLHSIKKAKSDAKDRFVYNQET